MVLNTIKSISSNFEQNPTKESILVINGLIKMSVTRKSRIWYLENLKKWYKACNVVLGIRIYFYATNNLNAICLKQKRFY